MSATCFGYAQSQREETAPDACRRTIEYPPGTQFITPAAAGAVFPQDLSPREAMGTLDFLKTFKRQIQLLLKKDGLLYLRNRGSSICLLLVGVFFIATIALTQLLLDANVQQDYVIQDMKPASYSPRGQIPPCYRVDGGECYAFAFTPSTSAVAVDLVETMLKRGGHPGIDVAGGAKGFKTSDEMIEWIFVNENRTRIAFDFHNADSLSAAGSTLHATLLVNSTAVCQLFGYKCFNNDNEWKIPAQVSLDSAVIELFDGADEPISIVPTFQPFPQPDLAFRSDAMEGFGAMFLFGVTMFQFIIQLQLVVTEKESQLREALKVNGLIHSAYWVSFFIVSTCVNVVLMTLMCLTGIVLGMEFFTENAFGLYWLLMVLMGQTMIGLVYLLQAFMRKASAARSLGFFLFIMFYIAGSILSSLYLTDDDPDDEWKRLLCSVFSPIVFFKGMSDLVSGAAGETEVGISWAERSNHTVYYPLTTVFEWLLLDFAIYTVLGWYFDHVIPGEVGRVEKPWFLFTPGFWTGNRSSSSAIDDIPVEIHDSADPDVRAEELAVQKKDFGEREVSVMVRNLHKKFGWPCSKNRFHAVQGISFAIDKNSVFCLLGHNGAGKTTTIRMLNVLISSSEGAATVNGHDIRHDLTGVRLSIGVCPQHDVLWKELTGREHVELFSGLRGTPASEIAQEVKYCLETVDLLPAADVTAGAYSGGMARRLSLALALIGKPEVLTLDEPTTGLDPVVRRAVWDTIQAIKKDRAVLLTTHSMEEADVLSDRVAIMSHGQFQAIGSSIRLKNKFGAGYRLSILMTSGSNFAGIHQFLAEKLPGCAMETRNDQEAIFRLPSLDEMQLSAFFEEIESMKESLGIARFSIGLTTLEEVFLALSEEDEIRSVLEKPEKGIRCRGCEVRMPMQGILSSQPLESGQLPPLVMCHECKTKQHLPTLLFFWRMECCSCGCSNIVKAGCRSQSCSKCHVAVSGGGDNSLGPLCTEPIAQALKEEIVVEMQQEAPPSQEGGEAEEKPRGAIEFSFLSQLNALVRKTVTYQMRQRGQLCCLISFPVLVILLLLLVSVIVSGQDVSGDYNYTCLNDAVLSFYKVQQGEFPELAVGRNGLFNHDEGKRGGNEDGSTVEFADFLFPYVGPDSLGARWTGQNEAFGEWLGSIRVELVNMQHCADDKDRDIQDNADLSNAENWRENQEASGSNFLTDQCKFEYLENPTAVARVDDDGGWSPSNSTLERLDELEEELTKCNKKSVEAIEKLLANQPSAAQESMSKNTGPLSAMDTDWIDYLYMDQVVGIVEEKLTASCGLSLANGVCYNATLLAQAKAAPCNVPYIETACLLMSDKALIRNFTVAQVAGNSEAALQEFLFSSWYGRNLTPGVFQGMFAAFDLTELNLVADPDNGVTASNVLKYAAYYNRTASGVKGMTTSELMGSTNWALLASLMDNVLLKERADRQVRMFTKSFPSEMDADMFKPFGGMSIVDMVGSFFFPFVLWLVFPIFISAIMFEKEHGLLVIMKMMGLRSSVYYVVMYALFLVEYIASTAVFWIAGSIMSINFFTLHDYFPHMLQLFMWGNILIAFSFLLCAVFRKTRSAVSVSFVLMMLSVIGGLLLIDMLWTEDAPDSKYNAYIWYPPFNMMRLLYFYLVASVFGDGVTWDNLDQTPFAKTMWVYVIQWIVMMVLFLYLDAVLPKGDSGVRKPPLFFLDWFKKGTAEDRRVGERDVEMTELQGEDVKAEAARVMDKESGAYLKSVNLVKEFPSTAGAPPKVAVGGVSLGVDRAECLGLLGANGAGKTTLISMMCGLLQPTSGSTFVGEQSLKEHLSEIQLRMGVCPQHDLLWDDLTAREHLLFYGRLKQLAGRELETSVKKALEAVQLSDTASKKAGEFSGGMRRRLSVANALVGNPDLVLLDEPSSGLDPASRHNLWKVITHAKKNKAILLTTHSLEEAEALCDRLAIQHSGQLRCIGTSSGLKARFGAGFSLTMTTTAPMDKVEAFMEQLCQGSRLSQAPVSNTMKWELPKANVDLAAVFAKMKQAREDLNVTDWGISETQLEEVFIKVTRGVEMSPGREMKRTLSQRVQQLEAAEEKKEEE